MLCRSLSVVNFAMSFACFFQFLDFLLKRIDFLRLPMENLAVSLLVLVIGQSKKHQSQTKFLVWNNLAGFNHFFLVGNLGECTQFLKDGQ